MYSLSDCLQLMIIVYTNTLNAIKFWREGKYYIYIDRYLNYIYLSIIYDIRITLKTKI